MAQIARALGVHRSQLYRWADEHEAFRDALSRARDFALAWWEDKAQAGIEKPTSEFNAGLYGKVMSARFPEDYRDTSRHEHTGKDGDPIETKTQVYAVTPEKAASIEEWAQQAKESGG